MYLLYSLPGQRFLESTPCHLPSKGGEAVCANIPQGGRRCLTIDALIPKATALTWTRQTRRNEKATRQMSREGRLTEISANPVLGWEPRPRPASRTTVRTACDLLKNGLDTDSRVQTYRFIHYTTGKLRLEPMSNARLDCVGAGPFYQPDQHAYHQLSWTSTELNLD